MSEAGESQRAFARRIGLSQPRVNQLIKEGLPVLANGRVDTEAAILWLEQNLDRERSARAREGSAGAVTGAGGSRQGKPAAAPPLAPPLPAAAAGAPMAEVRRQHEIVKVARARLRFETERGKLVSRDDVRILVFTRARRERNAHLAWIMRVAPLMAADLGVDPSRMFSVLDRHVRDHLADLAKIPLMDLPDS